MFKIYDNFTAIDDNKIPYSFSVERHTETANLHAGVTDNGFSLKSIGNRFVLNTPKFKNCVFKTNFTISYPYEYAPCFYIIFGYDRATRTGNALHVTYNLNESLSLALMSVKNGNYLPLSEETKEKWILPKDGYAELSFEIKGDDVVCKIDDAEFAFNVPNKRGLLAIDRQAFIGELIMKNVFFASDDDFETERIIETEVFEIPLTNGGDIPYTICYAVDKIDGEYYLTSVFDGGTKSRPLNKDERRGQYVAEIDWMAAPYIGIIAKEKKVIFNISDKENCFVDPNIFWDCQKIFFGDTELPFENRFKLENIKPEETETFIFGYRNLLCKGYSQQSGGREFHFSPNGDLTYSGSPIDGNDIYEVLSPADKKAVSLIPKDCPNYEGIIEHLKSNHYFSVSENIKFKLLFRTRTEPKFLNFKAKVKNVFETRVLAESETRVSVNTWWENYNEFSVEAEFSTLAVGVYKIVFEVFYGDKQYKTVSYAFEVYDENSDICPPLASDLPFMFTMNNEQKKLARNGFDLLNPMPSCDFEHYIACATTTPLEAERQEIWKSNKIFGRKWFAWLAIRTCDDYLSPKHDVTIKNADYLFNPGINTDCDPLGAYSLYPNRVDHWCGYFYNFPGVKSIIDEFFKENPSYLNKTVYNIGDEKITDEVFADIKRVCDKELTEYINARTETLVVERNRKIKELNPNAKRSIYGPLPPYNFPTITYHSLKYFGFPQNDCLTDEYYSGFSVFEDYPFSCSYQTYRGPFAAMTILVNQPSFTLYPELYTGSKGGCIDGAVKNAHAPMGDYDCPPYQNSTLAFEYVYNTAYKTSEGFAYWNTYGFHRGLDTCEYINEFVKNWHNVSEHKPVRPLKSIAYIVDYDGDDEAIFGGFNYYNQSEGGQTVVYECARESGVPSGFGLKFEALSTLTENDCDVLVIPSLAKADEKYIAEIRRLYNAGINLIAVSNIGGLEDIFGVEKAPLSETVRKIEYEGETEFVYNTEANFAYVPTSNSVVTVTANDGIPVIITTKRTAIVNTALLSLGSSDNSKIGVIKGTFIVGDLIRKAITENIIRLSSPKAFGENVGITLFEDEHGNRMLLAINYTPFDNREHGVKEAIVKINTDDVTQISSEIDVRAAKVDGKVKELRFDILPHGYAFVKLG